MSIKQVIVLRKDLNMRKGKMVAQGAHASMKVLLDSASPKPYQPDVLLLKVTPEMKAWTAGIFTKVCVGVNSEKELVDIYRAAKDAGIPCSLITDNGLTEFDGVSTRTAIAIGPDICENIDKITGHLKLL